jgi:hypothetical protein
MRDDAFTTMAQHCGESAATDLRRVTRRDEPHGVPVQIAQADEECAPCPGQVSSHVA